MTLPASQAFRDVVGPADSGKRRRLDWRTLNAIKAMVWQGLNRREAAETNGITDNGLYVALRRPEVKAMYLTMCEELRTSQKARNIHAAVRIRDESDNAMAQMAAVRWLDAPQDIQQSHKQTAPGVVLQIISDKQNTNIQQINQHTHTDQTDSVEQGNLGDETDQDQDGR